MNIREAEKIFLEIVATVNIGTIFDPINEDAIRDITYGNDEITIITPEDIKSYNENMKKLFEYVKKEEQYISYELFEKTIHKLMIKKEDSAVEKLMNIFSNMELSKYIYIKPLYGAHMRNNDTIEFYGYKFISQRHIKNYLSEYGDERRYESFLEKQGKIHYMCYVEIEIAAKDDIFAKSKANQELAKLDNILRFMSGSVYGGGLGMFNFNTELSGGYICIEKNKRVQIEPSMIKNPLGGIQIDDPWFFPGENGNKELWGIVISKNTTEFKKRILKAVDWIGRAINENDKSLSFLQSIFAIECLLQDQEGFITKSITAQIAEYAAFVVGKNPDERKEIDSLFRQLYSIRSKIAHGTASDIKDENERAIWLAKQIVISLLTRMEFNDIKNNADLRNVIINCRYSDCGDMNY